MDALSDPKKFLTIAEKRADQMKALGIDTVHKPEESDRVRQRTSLVFCGFVTDRGTTTKYFLTVDKEPYQELCFLLC